MCRCRTLINSRAYKALVCHVAIQATQRSYFVSASSCTLCALRAITPKLLQIQEALLLQTDRATWCVKLLPTAAQQCRNKLHNKSVPNRSRPNGVIRGLQPPTATNFVHQLTTRSTVVVITRSTVDEFCWPHHRLALTKFSKSKVCGKVSEESKAQLIFLITQFRIGHRKLPCQNPNLSV